MQPPMPSDCYPVVTETWLPRYRLDKMLCEMSFLRGYLYDWHQSAEDALDSWYVGVVDESLAQTLLATHSPAPIHELAPAVVPPAQ